MNRQKLTDEPQDRLDGYGSTKIQCIVHGFGACVEDIERRK